MATIFDLKERTVAETPLLLLDCELKSGTVEHWSTHRVEYLGTVYEARVLAHNLFEIETASDQGVDGIPRISVTLANADAHFSELERIAGFKGAKVTVRFVFFDLRAGTPAADGAVLFQGIANPPDEITEATFRLTAVNRMSMQRVLLPSVRIQRRCPWEFPATAEQRQEAISGGAQGRYSRFYRCGYSAGLAGGAGNLAGAEPFTACGYTRADCETRGMFGAGRFGGIEFMPPQIMVRSYGEKGTHLSPTPNNEARYNDFVPLLYGTAWYMPPITLARNDGNLTRMEVLLGMGPMAGVLKVLVNDVEIPLGQAGTNMTATGWYNVLSLGDRGGAFDQDFPGGDPYGSMAYLSVVVPNRINDGTTLPRIKVLAQGLRLASYGTDGSYLGDAFTANPAWIALDVLRRTGWGLEEIDAASFAAAAAYCGESISVTDAYGNARSFPRFECNLAIEKRRSAADVVRGIRNAARLLLTYGAGGLLELRVENTLALERGEKPAWSNSTEQLDGGWPSYEFGDGTNDTSGIARRASGEPTVRLWSRSMADTPNRYVVEFQDAFNEYQQDSFSLVDVEDVTRTGQEITANLAALGIANYDQAARLLKLNLDKAVRGNTYLEFETSVKALGLRPGDLIALTYLKEGFERQAFRILRIAPGMNYRTARITAQIHNDAWYDDSNGQGADGGRRQPGYGVGIPRPLQGNVVDEGGCVQFEIRESARESADGGMTLDAAVGFTAPPAPQPGGPQIPLVSLAATIGEGGNLAGGQSLYYAFSAVDAGGVESALSFVVRASIPEGTENASVTLAGLSFAAGTAGFHVYRGPNPEQMTRIAANQAVAGEFTDTGLAAGMDVPPDPNYDHANFYWRLELQPPCAAGLHSPASVGDNALEMAENQYRGMVARIISGKGAGQERTVTGNTATTLAVAPDWSVEPDETSVFAVTEAGWHFGASAKASPVEFEIPNRAGAVVQISGRSANVNGAEAAFELCTLTRWTIGGAGHADADVPAAPLFALGPARGQAGSLELSAVSFEDFTNTRTVTAGTLSVYYWDELSSPSEYALAGGVDAGATILELASAGGAQPGTYAQIDKEVVRVEEVLNGGASYRVTRGAHASTADAHAAGSVVYHLARKTLIVPFPRDFFGSPSSGSWGHEFALPNARVASAEFFATNMKGNSAVASGCLTYNADSGLRTMAGGQFSFQVQGYLAVDSQAAPELVVESARSVRDVFAIVREAADGPVALRITQNGTAYCEMTIAAGETMSNVVDGFGLGPLASEARVNLEVVSVGQTNPGADLTVVMRL